MCEPEPNAGVVHVYAKPTGRVHVAMRPASADRKKGGQDEKKHVRGVGDKEQRQYEHIKESAKKSGRYGERAEEVAARTVLKQHKKEGHQKGH